MTIEITWRSGSRSVIQDAVPNRIYEVNEVSAHPALVSKPEPARPAPLFRDVTSLLGHKHHEENFDDFSRQPLLSKKLSQSGPGIAWIDLNEDSHDELVVGAGRGGALGGVPPATMPSCSAFRQAASSSDPPDRCAKVRRTIS